MTTKQWIRYAEQHKAAIRRAMEKRILPFEIEGGFLVVRQQDVKRLIIEGKLPSVRPSKRK